MTSSSGPFSNTTVSRHSLFMNAAAPMLVTVLGIVRLPPVMAPDSSLLPNGTPSNAPIPIVVSPSFRFTFTSLVQPENADSPIVNTLPGMVTPVILTFSLKTFLPIAVTVSGIVTSPPVPL